MCKGVETANRAETGSVRTVAVIGAGVSGILTGLRLQQQGIDFTIFEKGDVNGLEAQPVFKYLKTSMMIPSGPLGDSKGNGCDDIDALVLPRGGFGGTTVTLWTPVCRSDIAWNFEKFLVGPDGEPVKRFRSDGPALPRPIASMEASGRARVYDVMIGQRAASQLLLIASVPCVIRSRYFPTGDISADIDALL